jgi:8-oxo-dGTP pyrophosphatase MutT (NUDIX family)
MIAAVNRIFNEKGELLILLRANKPFGWGLVGGKVDEGEVPAETNIRETVEETQIPKEVIQSTYIGTTKAFDDTDTNVFETRLDHTPTVIINKREHLSFRWINPEHIRESGLAFAGNTINFIELGEPVHIPEAIDAMTDRILVGMALENMQEKF